MSAISLIAKALAVTVFTINQSITWTTIGNVKTDLYEAWNTTVLNITNCEVRRKTTIDTTPCTTSNSDKMQDPWSIVIIPLVYHHSDYFKDSEFYYCTCCNSTQNIWVFSNPYQVINTDSNYAPGGSKAPVMTTSPAPLSFQQNTWNGDTTNEYKFSY